MPAALIVEPIPAKSVAAEVSTCGAVVKSDIVHHHRFKRTTTERTARSCG
ncbi:hypothetical protein I551_1692 [Mycobacterium ulcerans str. Harvey]|uniref:Uncharacterized protein n=1 Tax=Mycobacterium ulcerans str. Harvey TaxID=1299332 RepID=A0ABN0R4K4_MYCUL|nr:hypothetical protein I551_1692 [Mycobacterium ulcerans str. Harvey]